MILVTSDGLFSDSAQTGRVDLSASSVKRSAPLPPLPVQREEIIAECELCREERDVLVGENWEVDEGGMNRLVH